ncbi:MAG: sigma factor [Microcoleus sp.]
MNAELFPLYRSTVAEFGATHSKAIYYRNRLATINSRLIKRVAEQLDDRTPEDRADLEQLGALGLIRAIENFDPAKKTAFSSYALFFIRGEMTHFVRKQWGVRPKISRTDHDNYEKVVAAHRKAMRTCPNVSMTLIALNLEDKHGRKVFTEESWRELSELKSGAGIYQLDEQHDGATPENLAECLSALTGAGCQQRLTPKVLEVILDVAIRQSADIPLAEKLASTAKRLKLDIVVVENRYKMGIKQVLAEYNRVLDNAI